MRHNITTNNKKYAGCNHESYFDGMEDCLQPTNFFILTYVQCL